MKYSNQSGFTYLAALLLIVVMGIVLGSIGQVWSTALQREKEKELLFIGHQFRQAIGRYYQKSPGTDKKYPSALDDLLKDERQAATLRHLRKIYHDPMTGKAEWALVIVNGGITGVYSKSQATPLKSSNFSLADKKFEDSENYGDWKFVYTPNAP